jgi:DNA-binding NarL/FixJ family response regulator
VAGPLGRTFASSERLSECAVSQIATGTATVVLAAGLIATLAPVLAGQGEIEVVGICSDGAEVIGTIAQLRPDVALLSANVPGLSLIELLRQMKARVYPTKTLIVTDLCDHEFIGAILRNGAHGCLRPTASRGYLVKAILAVKRGDIWLERKLLARALTGLVRELDQAELPKADPIAGDSPNFSTLSQREKEIAALLAQGLTNKEIAKKLNVSNETIKKHLQKIFDKLGVHRRTQVVLRQLCERLIIS